MGSLCSWMEAPVVYGLHHVAFLRGWCASLLRGQKECKQCAARGQTLIYMCVVRYFVCALPGLIRQARACHLPKAQLCIVVIFYGTENCELATHSEKRHVARSCRERCTLLRHFSRVALNWVPV